MNEFDDVELDIEDLGEVSGGTGISTGSVTAYCKSCNNKLKDLGPVRTSDGGTTNIFICTNKKCKEYNKKKNNLQVRFP
ncbi:MAG: hypothetical protein IJ740_09935 [Ruminococcus sp.]|nr:hypothetical protein [Ruminococcus sp.]